MPPSPPTVGLVQINNSFSGACYIPLTAGLLQAYAEKFLPQDKKYQFLTPLFQRIPVDDAVDHLIKADIVGFNLSLWNFQLSMAIIKKLREKRSDQLIICGGAHVSERSEEFFQTSPLVDIAVHAEGEATFCEILNRYPNQDWSNLAGISYKDHQQKVHKNERRERIKDLSIIPSPYLSGTFEPLMKENPNIEWLGLWETNRGCPFQCTFCDWGSLTQSKVHRFDMERIYKELDWFSEKKVEFIFCCDANFGILKRDMDIVKHAAENKKKHGYPKALSVQNTKNASDRTFETQQILSDSGLNKGVTLAMQSMSSQVLLNVKRQNISIKAYENLQQRFQKNQIATYSDLLIGLPGETFESFIDGVDHLITNGQHNRIQLINLTVLPNSEIGDPEYQKKFGIQTVTTKILNHHGVFDTNKETIYETQELVIATDTLPPDMWKKTRVFSWMTSFLHFDKVLQIPLIVLHQSTGISYRDMINAFLQTDHDTYPLITEIKDFFDQRALEIQSGGSEYVHSKEMLDIWWPDDEYQWIRLSKEDKLTPFFKEAEQCLTDLLNKKGLKFSKTALEGALELNLKMLKQPFISEDLEITLKHNIFELYQSVLKGEPIDLKEEHSCYRLLRKQKNWDNWTSWCKEVVWFGNKKGDYLYDAQRVSGAS
ncbi:B12-binding domain-containing radical SAM protein [Magnetococcales bacterium HHB-1]